MSIIALRNLHEKFPLKSWSSWICEISIYLTPLVGRTDYGRMKTYDSESCAQEETVITE